MLIVSASRGKSLIHDCSFKLVDLHQQKNEAGNEAHVISPIPQVPLYIVAVVRTTFLLDMLFFLPAASLNYTFLCHFVVRIFGFMSGDAFNMLLILQHKQLWHVGNSEHPQPSPPITPFISPTLRWIPRENFTVSLNISQLPMFHAYIYMLCFTFRLFAALPNTSFLILAASVIRHKSLFYGCCTIFLLTAVILH